MASYSDNFYGAPGSQAADLDELFGEDDDFEASISISLNSMRRDDDGTMTRPSGAASSAEEASWASQSPTRRSATG